MISEFFIIERSEGFSVISLKYKLLLPDIFSDEDNFTQCGIIASEINGDGIILITITLFSNFEALSDGDTYTENDIIESLKYLIANDMGTFFERENFKIRR